MDGRISRKFQSGADKIAVVNSIRITKSNNFLYFFTVVVSYIYDVYIFKPAAHAQSIYREVYGLIYYFVINPTKQFNSQYSIIIT